MLRPLARLLVSPGAIAAFDLLILVPMALAIYEVTSALGSHQMMHQNIEILTGIGVLMIGWGVVLEERETLRGIFGIAHGTDDARQVHLDHMCHHFGLGQLVLGLLAEIFVELVNLPDKIVNTSGIETPVLWISLLFVITGAVLLAVHIVRLIAAAFE